MHKVFIWKLLYIIAWLAYFITFAFIYCLSPTTIMMLPESKDFVLRLCYLPIWGQNLTHSRCLGMFLAWNKAYRFIFTRRALISEFLFSYKPLPSERAKSSSTSRLFCCLLSSFELMALIPHIRSQEVLFLCVVIKWSLRLNVLTSLNFLSSSSLVGTLTTPVTYCPLLSWHHMTPCLSPVLASKFSALKLKEVGLHK